MVQAWTTRAVRPGQPTRLWELMAPAQGGGRQVVAHARELAAQAPPLTVEQPARLATLLRSSSTPLVGAAGGVA